MAITFEETIQTVLNLVQEREALKQEKQALSIQVTQLEAELHAIRKSDVAKMAPLTDIKIVKENK